MSDDALRRRQSDEARQRAIARAYATDQSNPEWQRQMAKNQAEAAQRLADTPERRKRMRDEYLEEIRRRERWDAEDRADEEEFEDLREKRREQRRKERRQ